jgi:hypothetical protein
VAAAQALPSASPVVLEAAAQVRPSQLRLALPAVAQVLRWLRILLGVADLNRLGSPQSRKTWSRRRRLPRIGLTLPLKKSASRAVLQSVADCLLRQRSEVPLVALPVANCCLIHHPIVDWTRLMRIRHCN